jgi:hypothetical protein
VLRAFGRRDRVGLYRRRYARDAVNPWRAEMFHTLRSVNPQTATEQSAYDRWMDQTAQRQEARNARLHGAQRIIPLPAWIAL